MKPKDEEQDMKEFVNNALKDQKIRATEHEIIHGKVQDESNVETK